MKLIMNFFSDFILQQLCANVGFIGFALFHRTSENRITKLFGRSNFIYLNDIMNEKTSSNVTFGSLATVM